MEICQFFDWNVSMLTFYDFLEEFLSLGVLSEEDKIATMNGGKQGNQQGSPGCVSPEPQESQILRFNQQNSSAPVSLKSSPKSLLRSSPGLDVSNLAPTAKKHLIKSIYRLSLHISHFIASEYITDISMQKEIAYLVVCLARKLLKIKNYKSDLLKELFNVTIKDQTNFIRMLLELERDFDDIFRYFKVNFNEFDDGLGTEEEAFGPFGPFDLTEREYDRDGNAAEIQDESRMKQKRLVKLRAMSVNERKRESSVFREYRKKETGNNLIQALVKVEYSEQKFNENKARRQSNTGRIEITDRGVIPVPTKIKIIGSGSVSRRSERDNPLRMSNKPSVQLSNKLSRSEKGSFLGDKNEDFLNMSVFSRRSREKNRDRYDSFHTQNMDDIVPSGDHHGRKLTDRPDIPKPSKRSYGNDNRNYFRPITIGSADLNNSGTRQRIGSEDFERIKVVNQMQQEEKKAEMKRSSKWNRKKQINTTPVGPGEALESRKKGLLSAYMSLPLQTQLEGVSIGKKEESKLKALAPGDTLVNNNTSIRTIESELLRGSRFIPLKGYKSDKNVPLPKRDPKSSLQVDNQSMRNTVENFLSNQQPGNKSAYNLASIPSSGVRKSDGVYQENRMLQGSENSIRIQTSTAKSSQVTNKSMVHGDNNIRGEIGAEDIKFSTAKKKINFRNDINLHQQIAANGNKPLIPSPNKINFNDNGGILVIPHIQFSDKKGKKGIEKIGDINRNSAIIESGQEKRSVKNSVSNVRNPLFAQTRLSRSRRGSNNQNDGTQIRSSSHQTIRTVSNSRKIKTVVQSTGLTQKNRPPGLPVYQNTGLQKSTRHLQGSVYKSKKDKANKSSKKSSKQKSNKKRNRTVNPQTLRYYPSNDESFSLKNITSSRRNKYSKVERGTFTKNVGSIERNVLKKSNYSSTRTNLNVTSNYTSLKTENYNSERNLPGRKKLGLKNKVKGLSFNNPKGVNNIKGSYYSKNYKPDRQVIDSSRDFGLKRGPKDSNVSAVSGSAVNNSLIFSKNSYAQGYRKKKYPRNNTLNSSLGGLKSPPVDLGNIINMKEAYKSGNNFNSVRKKSGNLKTFLDQGGKQQQPDNSNPKKKENSSRQIRLSKSIDHQFKITENFLKEQKNLSKRNSNQIEPKKIQSKKFSSFNGIQEIMAANSRTKTDQSPASSMQNNMRGSFNKINTLIAQNTGKNSAAGNNLRSSYMNNLNNLRVSSNVTSFKTQQSLQIQSFKQKLKGSHHLRVEPPQVNQSISSARGHLRRVQIANKMKQTESSRDCQLRRSNNAPIQNKINPGFSNSSRNQLMKGYYQDGRNLSRSPGKLNSLQSMMKQANSFNIINSNLGAKLATTNTTYLGGAGGSKKQNAEELNLSMRRKNPADVDKIYQQLKQKQKYSEALKQATNSSKMALKQVIESNNNVKGTNFDKFWLKKKGYLGSGGGAGVRRGLPSSGGFFKDVNSQRFNTDGNITNPMTGGYLKTNRVRRSRDRF